MRVALAARKIGISAIAGLFMPALCMPAYADTPMTAGVIMDKMKAGERAVYVVGMLDGLAYARFRKDSAAAGSKVETGMTCIYNWFYKDSTAAMDRIEAAFRNYAEQMPSVVVAAILKKECGE